MTGYPVFWIEQGHGYMIAQCLGTCDGGMAGCLACVGAGEHGFAGK